MIRSFVKVFFVAMMWRCAGGQFSAAVDASNVFAMNLFSAMPDSATTKNRFFSPASINVALAKILLGSAGETKAQLLSTLNWTNHNETAMHSMLHEFILKLGPRVFTKNKLIFASRIFVQENLSLKQQFVDAVNDLYLSPIGKVDFQNSEEARMKINVWVERASDRAIKRMVAVNTISNKTKLIVVDGLDYRGVWKTRFEHSRTYVEEFHLAKNKTFKLKMMRTYGKFFWRNCSALRSSVLELPYSGSAVSMVIILPNDVDGIKSVEESFSYQNYKDCFSGMMEEPVEVRFPRFRLREEYEMRNPLKSIGLEDLFTPRMADLSGIIDERELHVDRFIHLASMRILERGVVAPLPARERIHKFIVDRPFLFTIQDKQSGAILLLGKVRKPKPPTSTKNGSSKSNEKTPKKEVEKENQGERKSQPKKEDDS